MQKIYSVKFQRAQNGKTWEQKRTAQEESNSKAKNVIAIY